jgi:hypothetical protein
MYVLQVLEVPNVVRSSRPKAAKDVAIWIEKSEFKGMRLLVQTSLVTDSVRKEFRVTRASSAC